MPYFIKRKREKKRNKLKDLHGPHQKEDREKIKRKNDFKTNPTETQPTKFKLATLHKYQTMLITRPHTFSLYYMHRWFLNRYICKTRENY